MSAETAFTMRTRRPTTRSSGGCRLQRSCDCGQHTMGGATCGRCQEKKQAPLQRSAHVAQSTTAADALVPTIVGKVLGTPGTQIDASLRAYLEPLLGRDLGQIRMGAAAVSRLDSQLEIGDPRSDFEAEADSVAARLFRKSLPSAAPRYDLSHVRVHTDRQAAESARAVNARAYTVGNHIVFAEGQYVPRSEPGRRLLAHELTHVIQQQGAAPATIHRTLGDGHDLTSPRFSRLLDLEAAYDGETVLQRGSSGRGVQAVQQALNDLGFRMRTGGADGNYGPETESAVRAFQAANPPLSRDGRIGPATMTALNARFAAPVLPPPAARSAPWTQACVRSILCPWAPHTIELLRRRITLKSFDRIFWTDEQWDGASWGPAIFEGGGYNTGTEIGVLNTSCEDMAQLLYHEVLHAEQPTSHHTTFQRETYAYRIGEEFSIAMGLSGRPALRATDAQGRQFADPAAVGTFVTATYPSVPAGGGGDEIVGHGPGVGEVRVRRPNRTFYNRPAVIGEKIPGPMTRVNQATSPRAGWTCP